MKEQEDIELAGKKSKYHGKYNSMINILKEMLDIYKKYFNACETMGTVAMSPADEGRLKELEKEFITMSKM